MIRTVTKTLQTVSALAEQVKAGYHPGRPALFHLKSRRDAVAKMLRLDGCKVKLGRTFGQRLHPEYVIDFEGTYETGLGNTDCLTNWGTIYTLAVVGTPPLRAESEG